jgi:cytochrome c peroxidase
MMKRKRLMPLLVLAGYAALAAIMLFATTYGGAPAGAQPAPTPVPYNPYPPGILPADIIPEVARIEREVNFIENEALAQASALPTPFVTGNPPILQNTGQQANVLLGKLMNFDRSMSPFQNEACGFCHMPYTGFMGPIPSVNLTMIAYPGSFRFRAGKLSAQRYPYSPDFPVLNRNANAGAFFGGAFWDARATGYLLGSPDQDQAQHPPVDTQEMAFPDTACIAFRLQTAVYRTFFEEVWGAASLTIAFPSNTAQICDTPGGAAIFGTNTQPIALSPSDRDRATQVFNHWAQSLDAYEASPDVSAFSSKYDAFLEGMYTFTPDEAAGRALFNGRGNCNSCHLDGRSTAPTPPPPNGTLPNSTDTGAEAATEPLFTCFGYANLGLPLNPRDAIYYETTPDFFGFTANPFGFGFRNLGVGAFLRSAFGSGPNPNSTWIQFAPTSDGQQQTMTARDVGLAPPQCPTTEAPGPYFQKEFFHNGYAKSLKQLVHFYNTRDVFPFKVTSGNCPAGTTEKVDCWPMPEVPNNIDMTVGRLGLSDTEENQVVIFMQTLSDGFTTPYPDINTFTGQCMSGGTAATQGNAFLIPTPPLPPCASVICGVAPTPGPSPIP